MRLNVLFGLLAATLAMLAISVAPAASSSRLGCYVNVLVSGRTYTGTVTRSYRTSCPFAKRVTASSLRYIVKRGGAGDGDFYVTVWSPVTLKWYRMWCLADGDIHDPSLGVHVDCRGGIGARVIYTARER